MDPFQQQLLNWGIQNSNQEEIAKLADEIKAGKRPELNPDMITALMGEPDSKKMESAMGDIDAGADAPEGSEAEEKALHQWEVLELLVEDVNNANDLEPLKLWPKILPYLKSKNPEYVKWASWVVGTAVQNNPRGRIAVITADPDVIKTLISIVANTQLHDKVRAKGLYALSSLIANDPVGLDVFNNSDGWSALKSAMTSSTPALADKAAFSMANLLTECPKEQATRFVHELSSAGVGNDISQTLQSAEPSTNKWNGAFRLFCIFACNGDQDIIAKNASLVHSNISKDQLLDAGVDASMWDDVKKLATN